MDIVNLIEENEKLIYKLASFFTNCASLEDLYQAGCLGIIKASKNYDSNRSTKFSSYAYDYILGEMRLLIRQNKPFKISKEKSSLAYKIEKTRSLLTQKMMREPTTTELADFLEISEYQLAEILNSNKVDSLDNTYGDTNMMLHEIISAPYLEKDTLIMLKDMINSLEEPERTIMIERYYEDMTQSEVADNLGLNQTYVSRSENKVLKKFRQTI